MKTIILATDFSQGAKNAAHYAVQLVRDWQATLTLLHVYHYPPENLAKAGDFPLSVRMIREEAERSLKRLALDLHAHVAEPVTINYLLKEGYVLPTIQDVTRDLQADLLIMSTVGTAPDSARVFGSVATDMVPLTNVPLLLIPPRITYTPVNNIVLGINLLTPPNAVALDSTIRLAQQLNSVANILCVNDHPEAPETRERAEHIRHLFQVVPHTLTIQSASDVVEALLTFAKDNKADLIMMLPQARNWFERLIGEGDSERTSRLADIPVLAIM
jgi:nucleotide-binding universal stress UspA family protein